MGDSRRAIVCGYSVSYASKPPVLNVTAWSIAPVLASRWNAASRVHLSFS